MANLTRKADRPGASIDPFRIVRDVMRWDPFGDFGFGLGREVFAPSVEVRESKDAFIFSADLPGVKQDDLDVTVTGNRLTISGKRESEAADEGERYHAYERAYGTFSRSFTLPEGASLDELNAELNDGVLRISVPKKSEVQAKKVAIKAGGGEGESAKGKE